MEEWKTYKLSEIAKLSTGFPFDGSKYSKEGIRVVRGDNVTIGALRWETDKDKRWNIPFDRANEYSLQDGDIVVGMDGSRVGRNRAQVQQSDLPLLIAQRVACIRNNELSHQQFLYYQIFSNRFCDYIKSVQTGTSIPHVSLKQIGDYEVVLPSLPYQIKIANVLSALDSKIELNNRINHNLEQQAQIVFDRIFNSDLTNNCLLSSIVDINPKRMLRKNEVARCIDMTYLNTAGSFPSGWEFKPYSGGMKFINGDTLMARITPCLENGKVAYINFLDKEETAFGSTEYIVFHAKEGYPNEMFYFLTRNKAFIEFATKNMNGSSGRQRVSGETIGNYIIPVLSEDDISELKAVSESTMKEILKNNLESRVLSEMRNTILPKLMSGELKIIDLTC